MKKSTVLIMAGGTGGHVVPALTIAKALQDKNIAVHWLGTEKGLEHILVPKAKIPIHYISISGLRGKKIVSLVTAPFKLLAAIIQSIWVIINIKPDCVVGMGGFASGPGGIAAWLTMTPLIIHEQNAVAGMTNHYLSYLAKRVYYAFPNVFKKDKNARYFNVGNPVRDELGQFLPPKERLGSRKSDDINILVMGGSLGAVNINNCVIGMIKELSDNIKIWHQCGSKSYDHCKQLYKSSGKEPFELVPFIDDMIRAYHWADLVVCRAGALTVAELSAAGIASILIPYPYAVDDHQTLNARYLSDAGAALLIDQKELTTKWLRHEIMKLANDRELLLKMAQRAYEKRNVGATQKIVEGCQEVMGNG